MASETPAPPPNRGPSPGGRPHRFIDDEPEPALSGPRKPFSEYLRTTPAAPLSPGVKAILWAAAVAVALLLVVAAVRVVRHRPGPRPGAAAAGATP